MTKEEALKKIAELEKFVSDLDKPKYPKLAAGQIRCMSNKPDDYRIIVKSPVVMAERFGPYFAIDLYGNIVDWGSFIRSSHRPVVGYLRELEEIIYVEDN